MDRRTHSDEQARQTDLTGQEGAPSWKADVLPDRQKIETETKILGFIRFKTSSDTSSHSPAGVALAMLFLVIAALLPAVAIGMIANAAHSPSWMPPCAATLIFMIVLGAGICFVLKSIGSSRPRPAPEQPAARTPAPQHKAQQSGKTTKPQQRGRRRR